MILSFTCRLKLLLRQTNKQHSFVRREICRATGVLGPGAPHNHPRAENPDPSTRVSHAGACAWEPSLAQDDSSAVCFRRTANFVEAEYDVGFVKTLYCLLIRRVPVKSLR